MKRKQKEKTKEPSIAQFLQWVGDDITKGLKSQPAKKIKYECGHNDEVIPLTNSDMLDAWTNWGEIVSVGGDKSQCFNCFLKNRRNRIIGR